MKRYLILLGLFTISLVSCAHVDSETKSILKEVDKRLNDIEHMTYYLNSYEKYFTDRDTVHIRGEVTLLRNDKKRFSTDVNFVVNGEWVEDGEVVAKVLSKYDGQYFYSKLWNEHKIKDELYLDVNQTKESPFDYSITHFILNEYFEKKPFGNYFSFLASRYIESVEVEDVVFNDIECFKIIINVTERADVQNGFTHYYISKSDYLPIAYEFSGEYEGMKDYKFYTIDYLNINDEYLAMDYFQVEEPGVPLQTEVEQPIEIKVEEGQQAPHFIASSYEEQEIDIKDYLGKVVILDFWYRSCPPCLKAIPDLIEIDKENDDVIIIGINPIDSKETVREFLNSKGVQYASTYESKDIVEQYGVGEFPTTIIIDPKGKVHKILKGWDSDYKKDVEKSIKKLL